MPYVDRWLPSAIGPTKVGLAAFLPAAQISYHQSECHLPQGRLTRQTFEEVTQEINQPRNASFSCLNSFGAL